MYSGAGFFDARDAAPDPGAVYSPTRNPYRKLIHLYAEMR